MFLNLQFDIFITKAEHCWINSLRPSPTPFGLGDDLTLKIRSSPKFTQLLILPNNKDMGIW